LFVIHLNPRADLSLLSLLSESLMTMLSILTGGPNSPSASSGSEMTVTGTGPWTRDAESAILFCLGDICCRLENRSVLLSDKINKQKRAMLKSHEQPLKC
jgi:hypothetical protein